MEAAFSLGTRYTLAKIARKEDPDEHLRELF
jgi:hypothetical protein